MSGRYEKSAVIATEGLILREQGAQAARIHNLEEDIQEIKDKLDKVVDFVNETKGGHKFLWGVLAMASSIGAVLGAIITYFGGKH